ncbi:DUF5605 domain-containing protein [Nonomuraea sp. 3N208]|uniref:DUF5605 domain-containing protein n=1 Tax=Nonomuraea sp. 3N208 TaxID=3457421 RepID=UPI003FD6C02B
MPWVGAQDQYLASYHGFGQPRERHVLLLPGRWYVDVLDTWECTFDRLPTSPRPSSAPSTPRSSPSCQGWRSPGSRSIWPGPDARRANRPGAGHAAQPRPGTYRRYTGAPYSAGL